MSIKLHQLQQQHVIKVLWNDTIALSGTPVANHFISLTKQSSSAMVGFGVYL